MILSQPSLENMFNCIVLILSLSSILQNRDTLKTTLIRVMGVVVGVFFCCCFVFVLFFVVVFGPILDDRLKEKILKP